MAIHEIRHPLVRHKIGLARDADMSTKKFRELTAEIGRLLAYEACQDFPLEKVTTHRFGLKDVDLAIRSVGGQGVPDVIHASLIPWE